MNKLRNLQNKPTPKKKNKIFIKRAKKHRIVESDVSDAPSQVDKEPESKLDVITIAVAVSHTKNLREIAFSTKPSIFAFVASLILIFSPLLF